MKSHLNTTEPDAPASRALGGVSTLGGCAHATGGAAGARWETGWRVRSDFERCDLETTGGVGDAADDALQV